MQEHRPLKFRSIKEAVNWVCDDALDDHVSVDELTISGQETKNLGGPMCGAGGRVQGGWMYHRTIKAVTW